MPVLRSSIQFLSILLIPLMVSTPVFSSSETDIDINTNGSNSYSNVSVTNNAKTQTDIRIETNGEVQEYHSDTGEDVTITSKDGQSVVSVNNSGEDQSQIGPSSTLKPSTPPQPSNTLVPSPPTGASTPRSEQQMTEASDQSLFAAFIHWLINLF